MTSRARRQFICGRNPRCAFRADERYFIDKPRFHPGVCPNCGGPVDIVEAYTDHVIHDAVVAIANTATVRAGEMTTRDAMGVPNEE